MDDFQKKLKEARDFRWERFNETDAEEKLLRLSLIVAMKKKNETAPLAINLRNFGSNFDSIIFELICKAQSTPDNYYRLMLAFPEYVQLWEEWQNTEDEKEFFKKNKV